MDPEELLSVISLTYWAIKDVEKNRDVDGAIRNLKRIHAFLTDTEMEE